MNDPDPRYTSDGFDHDAVFADIVAHLDEEAAEPSRTAAPWSEGDATEDEPAQEAAAEHPPDEDRPQVWRAHDVDDDYEEHFEPPAVAPLPVGDLQFWAIIAGMGGGPLLLLYLVLFNREAGSLWILAAIAMSVGGFALLVARLPGNQEDDDDGARL